MVSTVKKSQARMPDAWERRNCPHVGPRRGAGLMPAARRIVAIDVADTRMPRPRSSPWIRL